MNWNKYFSLQWERQSRFQVCELSCFDLWNVLCEKTHRKNSEEVAWSSLDVLLASMIHVWCKIYWRSKKIIQNSLQCLTVWVTAWCKICWLEIAVWCRLSDSGLMTECLGKLAASYNTTKFVEIISVDCIPGYPDQMLPLLLIYIDGKCARNLQGDVPYGGRLTPEHIASVLTKIGAIIANTETDITTAWEFLHYQDFDLLAQVNLEHNSRTQILNIGVMFDLLGWPQNTLQTFSLQLEPLLLRQKQISQQHENSCDI